MFEIITIIWGITGVLAAIWFPYWGIFVADDLPHIILPIYITSVMVWATVLVACLSRLDDKDRGN